MTCSVSSRCNKETSLLHKIVSRSGKIQKSHKSKKKLRPLSRLQCVTMSNLEDLLDTSSGTVKDPKPKFLAEYQLPGQNDIIATDIRSDTPTQIAEWFDTIDLREVQLAFLEMREVYNDLIKSQSTTPTTVVIINTEMLRDFTIYAGTNLKTFVNENGTSPDCTSSE